jgi:hypothetical protein
MKGIYVLLLEMKEHGGGLNTTGEDKTLVEQNKQKYFPEPQMIYWLWAILLGFYLLYWIFIPGLTSQLLFFTLLSISFIGLVVLLIPTQKFLIRSVGAFLACAHPLFLSVVIVVIVGRDIRYVVSAILPFFLAIVGVSFGVYFLKKYLTIKKSSSVGYL